MSEYTPGPWWWGRDKKHQSAHNLNSGERPDVDIAIGGQGGYWLLEGICGNVRARTKADAALIAAAPDLLESLRVLREHCRNGDTGLSSSSWREDMAEADAAIEKAEA